MSTGQEVDMPSKGGVGFEYKYSKGAGVCTESVLFRSHCVHHECQRCKRHIREKSTAANVTFGGQKRFLLGLFTLNVDQGGSSAILPNYVFA